MVAFFRKKEKIPLEQFLSISIPTCFEFPTAYNLAKVDIGNDSIDEKLLTNVVDEVPSFMIAVNQMLLVLLAARGGIERFKGDSQHDISKTISYGYTVSTGKYLESKGLSHDKAADKAERVCSQSLQYVENAEQNLSDNVLAQDIFFQYCKFFADRMLPNSKSTDLHFVIFDFAKQLYKNIEGALSNIKVS